MPVVQIATQPNMIFVNAGSPAKSLDELLKRCAGARKLVYASPGAGTTPHLTAEMLFKVLAKLDVDRRCTSRAPGRWSRPSSAASRRSGRGAISGPLAQVRAGKLRALAVSSARRLADAARRADARRVGLPGHGGLHLDRRCSCPAGTPPEIVQRLNEAVNRALQAPDVRERLEALAFEPVGGTRPQFAEYVKAEIAKWGKVVARDGGEVRLRDGECASSRSTRQPFRSARRCGTRSSASPT